MTLHGEDVIATTLRDLGLAAYTEDGWVYVDLSDGRRLEISAFDGASLHGTILGPSSPHG